MSLRPSLLDPLFAPATVLPGAGPKVAVLIDKLVGTPERPARVVDLLFHLPQRGIARQLRGSIAEAPPGEPVTLGVTVVAHRPPQMTGGRKPFRVLVEDQTGDITLVFFNLPRARIEKMLPLGSHRYVSGRIELWDGFRQMVHPSRILDEKGLADLPAVEPIYGATEGLTSRAIGKLAVAALDRLPTLPEWQDRSWLDRQGWPAFADALRTEHRPAEAAETEEDLKTPARRRLAYDELLASQLALALVRSRMHRPPGRTNVGDGTLSRRIEAALPFGLTGAQTRALAEIRGDMGSDRRMLRLLQGDVGSGKTAVALLAMASAIEAGRQAAMMAPTEILARQHAERLRPMVEEAGLRLALLTGRDRVAERRATLAGLADGSIHIVVGTHALFQDDVAFHDLGLAVVDEQHRFGVHQRLALGGKGAAVDILVMTATPIPRTLALTCFGDMEVSVLDEKPAGRQPIKTVLVSTDRVEEVVLGLERALAKGDRVYWICPLVAESEYVDLAAAEERFSALRERFGDAVGLVHGKMPGKDKDEAMERFVVGDTKILVSTTVVEVGVDVPQATVMVIEHAERFGLAQLHQLRGRVGRGSGASTCLLLFKGPLGQVARARLEMMRETEDGFRIAEEDLRLRGEGEVLGTRQSGLAAFRLARPEADGDLIVAARDDARLTVERDPGLKSERGQALRALLYLFERDAAVKLLQAG
ncbi:ATP-dependent DNA helicase RecG [Methylobacterium frigidaeris]|uniref:ATP-dependent DNA helicase RecG n=1 Tax=Methylobacterium frigidaeris TaxID=2038277 RepID=A0AA37H8X7_9HYPH|nr:ATP-dependent DNA helicase RecG [Methylobacterium frigidaeris]GJD61608.1 ATP-dependent DNA helicase RecG [Methylobacterium frigidaeris]